MGCRLDKYTTYPLVTVTKDVGEGRLVARLESPPTSCPDGVFTTKNGSTRVVSGATPVLQYNHGKTLVTVPNKEFIREVNVPETGFGTVLFWTLAFAGIGYLIYRLVKNNTSSYAYSTSTSYGYTPYTPGGNVATPSTTPAPGTTTVINNTSGGNNGLVEGMLLNEMLHDHSTHTTEIIHEHDSNTFQSDEDTSVESDTDSSVESDDSDTSYGSDNNGSSFSSDDSGSSYSSDDSSSSSDSSWSSSDSSSDWGSSDSGSSFDSGGGSFDS